MSLMNAECRMMNVETCIVPFMLTESSDLSCSPQDCSRVSIIATSPSANLHDKFLLDEMTQQVTHMDAMKQAISQVHIQNAIWDAEQRLTEDAKHFSC